MAWKTIKLGVEYQANIRFPSLCFPALLNYLNYSPHPPKKKKKKAITQQKNAASEKKKREKYQ